MTYRVGVDIGGTFTDFIVSDAEGRVHQWKEDTTPDDPTRAIRTGLEAIARELGQDLAHILRDTSLVVHGTTIATNAVIQRSGPEVGLLCTEGFRDILYFRDGYKPDRFNIHLPHPPDFIGRHLRIGVAERMDSQGEALVPLSEDGVRRAAERFRASGVASVAVAFLWSIVNPAHEHRAAEILREELPGVHVICSSDLLAETREWARTSAAALSAYILPLIADYLGRLEGVLGEEGLERSPLIMQVNGGCASVNEILRSPVYVLDSGPAAAPAAALLAGHGADLQDLISVDMGGTSFDVCVIRAGRPAMSREIHVEGQPIGVTGVEVKSVGAGGGSIAWIDSGGALRVGPRSAGARPGPACYGAGGTEPTITDANVVLGYLEPEAFLGGRRVLRSDLAVDAIRERIAGPLGLDVVMAAAGIVRVVNSNMVNAIRAVSIERGIDPRGFALVVGGGAGGLHASRLAGALQMTRVLIPREAGAYCAFGMIVTDVRHDYAQTFRAVSTDVDLAQLDAIFAGLEEEATRRLQAEGFTADSITLERWVDGRYLGQVHELTVPLPSSPKYGSADLQAAVDAFHASHAQRFAFSRPNVPVEFLHWRTTAIGRLPLAAAASVEGGRDDDGAAADAQIGERAAHFEELEGRVPTPVYSAEALRGGARVSGPAIVQAPTTTILINPGDVLALTSDGNYLMAVGSPVATLAAT